MLKKYMWNVLIAFDQFWNAVLGGDPDETISSRLGKRARSGKSDWITRTLCWGLDKLDRNHCEDAIEEDEGKDQL